MTDVDLIEKILTSKRPSDIFNGEWKKDYLRYSKLIHPDACKQPYADKAMATLNQYKDILQYGIEYVDEAGKFYVFDNKIEYEVTDTNRTLIGKSVSNYKKLKKISDNASFSFHKYLPQEMVLEKNKLTIKLTDRAVPLTHKQLEQVHVNWVFSRMFEFVLWLRQNDYSHMGLNPTTVFVVPETHGIVIISFYHMNVLYKKAKTLSAKYKMWYPTTLFTEKVSTPDVDLELVKKIALYLLGDKSGGGTKLKMNKKDVNQEILMFLLTKHENHFNEYKQFRELLAKNFKRKFYPLDL